MKKMLASILLTLFSFLAVGETVGHTERGTLYGSESVAAYDRMRHGPDGALFLDPYFMPFLINIEGKTLLDAGCGAGPWSVFAEIGRAHV